MSPTFSFLILPSGLPLGLWEKGGVQPAPTAEAGSGELGFKVNSAGCVDATYATWQSKGAEIVLPPTDLPFGRSFVAVDPDGHRLRVYAVADGQ